MNTIRKAFAAEVARLGPVLHETYRSIGCFQKRRTAANERRVQQQLEVLAHALAFFRPYVPEPKQGYFSALSDPALGISDRIIALDVAVGAMHIDFPVQRAYMHQESARLREALESSRVSEEDLCRDDRATPAGALLRGIPASPGVVVGEAVVGSSVRQLDHDSSGVILVTRAPRPESILELTHLAGIVADTGGRLCHAAIIARELRIPCVVGTQRATGLIQTGWRLRLDGTSGEVRREDVPPIS